jgi:hypothetical protein
MSNADQAEGIVAHMFTGVHLSVIVNDWNKVAPVTDLELR